MARGLRLSAALTGTPNALSICFQGISVHPGLPRRILQALDLLILASELQAATPPVWDPDLVRSYQRRPREDTGVSVLAPWPLARATSPYGVAMQGTHEASNPVFP
ncbi:hypothetical protein BU23DRAFT_575309 [Bimuria novae-zelandiae CBS 107.79]|uniref:Uncharacterized protein n=1 Tax=Bimuria novae-zelandiae CBS 107.79 TaxID=1447943 RepID=A0A6A5UM67_9PLEO|nr:hypothetical protein BU23DRAFT_575309 [Bimuria novae-zelandiae CBS 107.79]